MALQAIRKSRGHPSLLPGITKFSEPLFGVPAPLETGCPWAEPTEFDPSPLEPKARAVTDRFVVGFPRGSWSDGRPGRPKNAWG